MRGHWDTAITLVVLVCGVGYMAWQAFSHPEMTRTQLALANWPALLVVSLFLLVSAALDWRRRR
jgi:hypothetical protein